MSVGEMSEALRKHVSEKFSTLSRSNVKYYKEVISVTPVLRKKYESAQSGSSSLFTSTGLTRLSEDIVNSIQDVAVKKNVEKILTKIDYNHFFSYVKSVQTTGNIVDLGGGFRLEKVPQATLKNLFIEYLSIILHDVKNSEHIIKNIQENIQTGHLAGVFSLKIKESLFLEAKYKDNATNYRDFTISLNSEGDKRVNSLLEKILKSLLDADYLTSNIIDKTDLFTSATKAIFGKNTHLEIELQFTKDNKAAGNLLKIAGLRLNNLISTLTATQQLGADTVTNSLGNLILAIQPLADTIINRAYLLDSQPNAKKLKEAILGDARDLKLLADDFINKRGSASIRESIGIGLAHIINTGKVLPGQVSKAHNKVTSSKKDDVISSNNKKIKNLSLAINKAQRKIKDSAISGIVRSRVIQNLKPRESLTSLQNLINSHLQSVISANMGDGSERRVLNYRTGRFAGSAKVESISQGREGMLTAYYSYMKYPYATFSEGGRQQYPRTRDPKLLISGAIREIAATKVGNRMRAVLI